MEQVTQFWCRKPDGSRFKLRVFGEGDNRMTSRGVVNEKDGVWSFQTPCSDGVEIDGPVEK